MRTRLAWQNLLHRKTQTGIAIAGVCFPILLVFAQLGFYDAVVKTATLIHEELDADVFIMSRTYLFVAESGTFPRSRLYEAAAVDGVDSVSPLYAAIRIYRNPTTGDRRQVVLFGVNPSERPFLRSDLNARLAALTIPDTVLIDSDSRPELGRREAGVRTEMHGRQIEIVGQYQLGPGFAALGDLITTDLTFARLYEGRSLEDVSLGLVRLRPGAKPDAIADALRRRLPADVRVATRDEMMTLERNFWRTRTSIGIIFSFGVVVASAVAFLILYQVLSADITRRISEYATLKAIGYDDHQLSRIVVEQSLVIAAASYLPALLLSAAIYALARRGANLPIAMTASRAIGVLVMAVGMSAGSGWLALRKLAAADPADLFTAQR